MAVTCDLCGVTSDLDETFIKVRRSFRLKKRTYCPPCWLKRQVSPKPLLWVFGLTLLIGIIAVVQDRKGDWLLLNLFFTGMCVFLMIIPHELGHAFVARWLGARVFKIVLGSGRLIRAGTMFGFRYEARQFPLYGLTLYSARSSRWYRLKRFCIVLAGPGVNLSLLLVAVHIPHAQSLRQSLSQSLSPLGCLILANAWILLTNLLPYNVKLLQAKIPNDGLSLLTIPFLPRRKIKEALAFYYHFEGEEFLENHQYHQAKTAYIHGLSLYPDNTFLKNGLGVSLVEAGEVEEARTIFTELLERSDGSNKLLHALLLNNLAYSSILVDRQGLLEEADRLSTQAFQSFPWVPAFMGTRGIVLIELGRLDEGILLLKQAMGKNEGARSKAIDSAYLAIAEGRRGNIERAREYLDAAVQFDASCSLIEQARNELFQLMTPVPNMSPMRADLADAS